MEKPIKMSQCPHVEAVGDNAWEDVIKRKRIQAVCEQCDRTGPNLWLCLHDRCLYVACGESGDDCSTHHGKLEKHPLTLNLTSMRIWCYKCECEVYKDANIPQFYMRERSMSVTPLSMPTTPEHRLSVGATAAQQYCPNPRKHSPGPLMDEESSEDDEDMNKPRGLTGLQNIGNTCYMNAAIQALSNCPPLTRFFLDCSGFIQLVPPDRKPAMSRSFGKLLSEIWHNKRPAYVIPSSVASGIKMVHPMFRGYTQQDTQEFLRCFMDQIHEELKEPIIDDDTDEEEELEVEPPINMGAAANDKSCNSLEIDRLSSQMSQASTKATTKESDNEYETCESGGNSERSSVENSTSNEDLQQQQQQSSDRNSGLYNRRNNSKNNENVVADGCEQDMDTQCSAGGDGVLKLSAVSVNPCHSESSIPTAVATADKNKDNEDCRNTGSCDVLPSSECNSPAASPNYSPPVTRSAQKSHKVSSTSQHEQHSLSPTDSGIGMESSSSNLSLQSTVNGINVNTTNTAAAAASAKDVKDSVNIAHQKQHGERCEERGRPPRQSESEADSQVSGKQDQHTVGSSRLTRSSRSRQASETDRNYSIPAPLTQAGHQASQRQMKKKQTRYHSVISDVFDGKVLSSVQCLTCERVSTTRETFQDLSLPIPNKDHLQMIHNQPPTHLLTAGGAGGPHKNSCGEVTINQGWFSWMFGWMRSWFWGPTVKLQDCLAAFFSADELKGDNMYSCEKCKKLRNGVKYSRVLKLPEILCVHLKRFRHEFMFSTKIATHVTFPMDGLDMGPYLHKHCADQTRLYDLVAIICHHGTAGGGHYTAYCLNYINETWYEFDDQYVTAVDIQTVENCEAYVLFYRKRNDDMLSKRKKAQEIAETHENSFMKFYVSRQWINRFNMFAEPGPITNHDFLCKHGGVPPYKWDNVNGLVMEVSQVMWEYLHNMYGGGPAVTHLYTCTTCKEEMERLKFRQVFEKETFIKLNDDFIREEGSGAIYAISISWFKQWENFVKDRVQDPPCPIDNSRICAVKGGVPLLKHNSEYGQISEEMWQFLHDIYGGGPLVLYRLALKPEPQYTRQAEEDVDMDEQN